MAAQPSTNGAEQPGAMAAPHRLTVNTDTPPLYQFAESGSDAIDKHFQAAHEGIDTAWVRVRELLKPRPDYSEAYKALYTKNGKMIEDLHRVSAKCLSLHKQLEEAEGTISVLESNIKTLEGEKADRAEMHAADRIDAAEKKIDELERDKDEALARAASAENRLSNLLEHTTSVEKNLLLTQELDRPATRSRKRKTLERV